MGEAGLPGAGPGPWARAAAQGVWLVYLLYPISQFAAHPGPPARVVLGLGLLLVFLAAYGAMWRRPFQLTDAGRLAWAGVLTALSLLAAVLLNLPVALGGLVYVGPVLGFLVDRRLALMGIGVVTAILAAAWRVMPLSPALFWSLVLSFVAVAVAMQIWGGFWRMGMRLRLAEEQLRDMAVLEERLGLSRDLHDVVGHRLSAIAVRAELAAQQARGLAPEGADEMLRVAQMARDALGDVRRMLSRWQAVSLRHEWADARATLEASGIRVVESGMDLEVPVALDRGLGFFVKEGATNILRHSNATRCRLSLALTPDGRHLTVELTDNGRTPVPPVGGGSGLIGVQERFAAQGGRVMAEQTADGFRLALEVPWRGV